MRWEDEVRSELQLQNRGCHNLQEAFCGAFIDDLASSGETNGWKNMSGLCQKRTCVVLMGGRAGGEAGGSHLVIVCWGAESLRRL